MRLVPVVTIPISLADIFYSISYSLDNQIIQRFKEALSQRSGYKNIFLFSKGRIGLAKLLSNLHSKAGKNEVIIPAYTCPTVLSSVLYAGLKPVFADVGKKNLNIEPEDISSLLSDRTLAVVIPHMFGKKADISKIRIILKNQAIWLIEDAAQSAELILDRDIFNPDEAQSDFVLLSFGRGKSITTIEGGAILTNTDLTDQQKSNLLTADFNYSFSHGVQISLKLILYPLVLKPFVYYILSKFGQIKKTESKESFQSYKYNRLQAALGIRMLMKSKDLGEKRRLNGRFLHSLIQNNEHLSVQETSDNAYLRFAILCASESIAAEIITGLKKRGIDCSLRPFPNLIRIIRGENMNPDDFPVSETAANQLVTLPTHPAVRSRDLARIKECIKQYYLI